MKLRWMQFGPYGQKWWGFKIEKYENHSGRGKYRFCISFVLGLGTRRAWDGYQIANNIAHVYGFAIDYGKPLPIIEEKEEDELLQDLEQMNRASDAQSRQWSKLKAEKQIAVVERDVLQNNLAAFEAAIRHEFKEREDKLIKDRSVLVNMLRCVLNEGIDTSTDGGMAYIKNALKAVGEESYMEDFA